MLHWITKKKSENCIYKFAVTPKNISEEELFLNDLKIISNDFSIIGIAMGEIGVYSRLFGDRFGSFATYSCVGKPRAPGQVNIVTLKKIREEYKDKPLPEIGSKMV
jgi:3-dehydroquinate dehydratase-1